VVGGRIERGEKSEITFAAELLPSSGNFRIVVCAAKMAVKVTWLLRTGVQVL
jgi:hypothetical protein